MQAQFHFATCSAYIPTTTAPSAGVRCSLFEPIARGTHRSTFRVVHDDGRVHWLHMERRAIVHEDNSKDVVRIVGSALEIGAQARLSRAA